MVGGGGGGFRRGEGDKMEGVRGGRVMLISGVLARRKAANITHDMRANQGFHPLFVYILQLVYTLYICTLVQYTLRQVGEIDFYHAPNKKDVYVILFF